SQNAFAAKVNAAGTGFDYTGFIGGTGQDHGYAIAVDATGHAYLGGDSYSSDFPFQVGPSSVAGINPNGWVAKLDVNGTRLYSGYLPGVDRGGGIAVDPSGNAYV